MDEQPQYLTTAQAATMMQVSRVTIYRWVTSGKIPAVKIGGSWRVSTKAIEALFLTPALSQESAKALVQALPLNGH